MLYKFQHVLPPPITAPRLTASCRIETSVWELLRSFGFWRNIADFSYPSGRAVKGVGLRPLARWECEFKYPRGHGCLSVVSVGGYQVDVSVIVQSLVQRSGTECRVSECDREVCIMRWPWRARDFCAVKKNIAHFRVILLNDMNQLVTGIGLVLG